MVDTQRVQELLEQWLSKRLDASTMAWIKERQAIARSNDKRGFFLAFGMAPRKVGKADLGLTTDELATADAVRPGWNPQGWSIDQAVRTLLVLSLPEQSPDSLVATLDELFATGEVGELVALYQALPLLPHSSAHILRAAEGIRTNIKAVFCAVAHRNPYPSEQFHEDQWNQMVLKCQFIGVPMSPIVGLDKRANAKLSSMVVDFIHERRAAKRPVPADMWRCVGRFADDRGIEELTSLLSTGTKTERCAAVLALTDSTNPDAQKVLANVPDICKHVAETNVTWETIEASNG